jgi:hypothetical protein
MWKEVEQEAATVEERMWTMLQEVEQKDAAAAAAWLECKSACSSWQVLWQAQGDQNDARKGDQPV